MDSLEKKVTDALECCHKYFNGDDCACQTDCPYEKEDKCVGQLSDDTLAVLHDKNALISALKRKGEKGHWVFGNTQGHGWMKCSVCLVSQDGQTGCWSYCPNCGASMIEEGDRE